MEKYFGNAYRGDPGVPHAPGKRFTNIWIGAAAFSAVACYHDQAMIHEQKKWKEARRENKPYKSDWNEKGRDFRDSYYFNWPNYFP
ncbi:hypothetical protein LINPERHAP1_LOCUS24206 [Linum perenne]